MVPLALPFIKFFYALFFRNIQWINTSF
jgi:hypothetical protein